MPNDTTVLFSEWLREHASLFTPYLESPDDVMVAIDRTAAKVAFDGPTNGFMRKLKLAEAEGASYSIVSVQGLRSQGILVNRRVAAGLPPLEKPVAVVLPPVNPAAVPVPMGRVPGEVLGRTRDLVMLDEASFRGAGAPPLVLDLAAHSSDIRRYLERVKQDTLDICYLIEQIPAGREATIAVTAASALHMRLQTLLRGE